MEESCQQQCASDYDRECDACDPLPSPRDNVAQRSHDNGRENQAEKALALTGNRWPASESLGWTDPDHHGSM
jgi:hypothetical protein